MRTEKISYINLHQQDNKASMSGYSRMFRGKLRMSTCRIILITSLAWLLIDVILIMKYSDGLSGGLFKKSRHNEVSCHAFVLSELENLLLTPSTKAIIYCPD